ncbi:penicillin-binding protein PBP4 [Staphylococcus sp. SQ8-PEA]|uniref:Penicillin-binding protein PBP4 n=1 Tax=Staphylococcus marylandisciuri TaxID=2981529 RepID=A0ABT2QSJ4_9STAP|nr:penicillin-binding protein PBP4 [Staphylococcus marylandisciuri]MCU5746918.1 penicillin-binding protein PBP4 [Staphylococcus marylandisciuri]
MKKLILTIVTVLFVCSIITPLAHAETVPPSQIANQYGYNNVSSAYEPTGAANVAQNGQVLYQYNWEQKWYPASMTKLMTMYLTMEAIKKGKLSLDDKVEITNDHYRMSTLPELSNTKLYPGETYTIKELLQITVSASSNAAALILAKAVSGDVSDFTDEMNKKAKALKMTQTHFVNPTGAENSRLKEFAPTRYRDEENSVASTKDFEILSLHVVTDTPKLLDFTKQLAPTQHNVTYYTFNHSLEGADMSSKGTDGLKTGSSDTANYNHTLSTKRQDLRIVQTIMGAGDYVHLGGEKQRNMMGNALLDLSYDNYKYKRVLKKGNHTINGRKYYVSKDLYDVVPNDLSDDKYQFKVEDGHVFLDYKREFINDDYGPPTAEVKKPILHEATTVAKSTWEEHPLIFAVVMSLVLITLIVLIYLFLTYIKRKLKH